ncbi:MAG: single-stranded DNA-binding protein [Armatimonadota bacterium]
MADLNFVALTGFSTREPALRQKSSGQIKAEFSFEVDRPFLRANGEPVSDLFLVDAWQELGEWVMENVKAGTRLMIVGTLNKESYNSHGAREHMTIVKAKYIRKTSGGLADQTGELAGLKGDSWDQELLLTACEIIHEAIEDEEAPATLDSVEIAGRA